MKTLAVIIAAVALLTVAVACIGTRWPMVWSIAGFGATLVVGAIAIEISLDQGRILEKQERLLDAFRRAYNDRDATIDHETHVTYRRTAEASVAVGAQASVEGRPARRERLPQEWIEAIRNRLDDATPGTWASGKIPGTIVAAVAEKVIEESGVTQEVLDRYGGLPVASDVGEADRQFICQVRDDAGRLLEDRECLLGRIAELQGQRWPRSRG